MIRLENLDENEKKLMIEFLPMSEVIKFLKKKKNTKKFSKELAGTRIDEKSRLLQMRLPKIFLTAIEQRDNITINFIKSAIYIKLTKINNYLISKLGSIENIKQILQKKEKESYMKLVKVFQEKVDPKYILLVLKLNEIDIKVRQKKLMQDSIEEFIQYKKIKAQVVEEQKEKLDIEYKKKIRLIEEKGQSSLKNQEAINKELRYQLSNKDRIIKKENEKFNLKVKELEEERKKYKSLEKKLELANYEVKKVKESLKDSKISYEQYIEKEIHKNKELEEIVEEQIIIINRLDCELKERYEIYSEKYLLKCEEEYKEIIGKKTNLVKQIEILKNTFNTLQDEIIGLKEEKEKAKKKLDEYNELVNNFINNIDKELIMSTLKSSILNIKEPNATIEEKKVKLYTKESVKSDEIEKSNTIDEWNEILAQNLKNIGVRKERNLWSDYIISILAAKMIPLIVGYKTRDVANSISSSYAGETPFIISLPANYSDLNELIDIYHNCSSKVILIEGVIGQMNESLILPLFKEYIEAKEADKIIIISCEDINMVDLIPFYLFEYIAPIEIKDIRPVMKCSYVHANNVDTLRTMRKSELDISFSYKKLSRLFKNVDNFNAYIMTRTLILAYLCQQIKYDNALMCLGMCDLKFVIKDEDIKEKIEYNIENYKNDFCEDFKTLVVGE